MRRFRSHLAVAPAGVLLLGAVSLMLIVGAPPRARVLGQAAPTVPFPGTVQLPPYGTVAFEQPTPPGGPAFPSAPPRLIVVNHTQFVSTVTFTGSLLTVEVPTGFLVIFEAGCTARAANPASCPKNACGQECLAEPDLATVTFTVAAAVPHVYLPGWNLVSGTIAQADALEDPDNFTGYTWQAGDTAYEPVDAAGPFAATGGYWVYLATGMTITVPYATPMGSGSNFTTLPVSAGGFVLIGNPWTTPTRIDNATALYTYDPMLGRYVAVGALVTGQGVWAYTPAATTLLLSAVTGCLTPPPPAVPPGIRLPPQPTPTVIPGVSSLVSCIPPLSP